MAIKLTPPSPGRIILGPRGGRRRVGQFKPWLTNAAGTPTFSTQEGASGFAYPVMTILLTDGNTWNYIFPATEQALNQSWSTPTLTGTSTFTPNGVDGVAWDAVASGPAFSFSQNEGFFPWLGTATPLKFSGTFSRAIGALPEQVFMLLQDTNGVTYDTIDFVSVPAGPWEWDTMLPDTMGTALTMQFTTVVQIGSTVTLEQTGSGRIVDSDFWNLYKTFPVPGFPGQWFGEWFNAVAWGTQLARVLNADLSTWLSTH